MTGAPEKPSVLSVERTVESAAPASALCSGALVGPLASEELNCPDCGRPLKAKKSWGGLMACYCRWNGRNPTTSQIIKAVEAEERPNVPHQPTRGFGTQSPSENEK